MWYGTLMCLSLAVIGWMLWASIYTPVPLKTARKTSRTQMPAGAGLEGRMPAVLPPPKGKKEVGRVMINNAESGVQIPMILYHTDAAGIESDVDRFIKQFQIDPTQYRDQLLQTAYARIEDMTGQGSAKRMPGSMPAMGDSARTLQGSRFDDGDDFEDDDDDDEWDPDEKEGTQTKAEAEEEEEDGEEEEWDPHAQDAARAKASLKSVPHPTAPPPRARPPHPPSPTRQSKPATSHGKDKDADQGDDEWAEEDDDHDLLPKSPPPKQAAARAARQTPPKVSVLIADAQASSEDARGDCMHGFVS